MKTKELVRKKEELRIKKGQNNGFSKEDYKKILGMSLPEKLIYDRKRRPVPQETLYDQDDGMKEFF